MLIGPDYPNVPEDDGTCMFAPADADGEADALLEIEYLFVSAVDRSGWPCEHGSTHVGQANHWEPTAPSVAGGKSIAVNAVER